MGEGDSCGGWEDAADFADAIGRALIDAAFDHCIRSGNFPCEVNRALEGPKAEKDPNTERFKASKIAVKLVKYFGWPWNEEHDIYIWDRQRLHDLFEYPIVDAPTFTADDELMEFQD